MKKTTTFASGDVAMQLSFLADLAANNDRRWFAEQRARCDAARSGFELLVADVIREMAPFAPELAGVDAHEAMFRLYRDTRFSNDKSPYKRHFGAYICERGRKSYHGGYYVHLQPDECMLAAGCWQLTTPMVHAIRQTIVGAPDAFRDIVEAPEFASLFKSVTYDALKVMPRDVPRDFPYPQYVKCRNYCVGINVPDSFFLAADATAAIARIFKVAKPFVDYINDIVDDYI